MNPRKAPDPRRRMRGFSMVELMVSITIGSLLTLVVAQLFSNTRGTNRAQEEAARMQENTRYALATIGRTVKLAGYKSKPDANASLIFVPGTSDALAGTDGAAPASDTLIVRYQGGGTAAGAADSTVLNCLGVPVVPDFDGTTSSFNRFSIAQGADGNNALFCQTDPLNAAAGTELVAGIDAMQVLFGEDTSAPSDSVADRFIAPGAVPAANLNNVVTVRVYLLIASVQSVRLDPTAANYDLAGQNYPYTDLRLRRVATTTVTLRNRVP